VHALISVPRRSVPATILAIVALTVLGPPALAADTLSVTTPYPAIVIGPGSKATFDLSVRTSTAARVDLSLSGVPSGWTAALRGGGFEVQAVQTSGTDPQTVSVDVTVPDTATGSAKIVVTATGLGQTVTLPLDVRVDAAAAGDVTMTTDVPAQRGTASSTFSFNLQVQNSTAQDLTLSVSAQGPDGWTVDAKLTAESQAASAIVKAGSSSGVSITANPPSDVVAGAYPITVTATAGTKQVQQALEVDITGSYTMSMTTPSAVLSGSGSVGAVTEQQFVITNTGSAPITNVAMTASAPTNWKIEFDQPTIATVAPNAPVTVTAKITPSSDAITGDYQIIFKATGDQANASQDFRFTVETGIEWLVIGLGLIVLVGIGVWWVFRRYGRR
jgi:uncharacterized membrane protein